MFDITGRILTIVKVSEKFSKIVLKKTFRGKQVPIAIGVWGDCKAKMDELRLNKNDKIQGKVFPKSNLYNGKWYTDLYFLEIKRYVQKPKWNGLVDTAQKPKNKPEELFDDLSNGIGYIVDEETGEILL